MQRNISAGTLVYCPGIHMLEPHVLVSLQRISKKFPYKIRTHELSCLHAPDQKICIAQAKNNHGKMVQIQLIWSCDRFNILEKQ